MSKQHSFKKIGKPDYRGPNIELKKRVKEKRKKERKSISLHKDLYCISPESIANKQINPEKEKRTNRRDEEVLPSAFSIHTRIHNEPSPFPPPPIHLIPQPPTPPEEKPHPSPHRLPNPNGTHGNRHQKGETPPERSLREESEVEIIPKKRDASHIRRGGGEKGCGHDPMPRRDFAGDHEEFGGEEGGVGEGDHEEPGREMAVQRKKARQERGREKGEEEEEGERDEGEDGRHGVAGGVADEEPVAVEGDGLAAEHDGEDGLGDGGDEAAVHDEEGEFGGAFVGVAAVPDEEFGDVRELGEGEVGGEGGLSAFFADDAEADVRRLDHGDVVAAVADAGDAFAGPGADEEGEVGFLGRGAATRDHGGETHGGGDEVLFVVGEGPKATRANSFRLSPAMVWMILIPALRRSSREALTLGWSLFKGLVSLPGEVLSTNDERTQSLATTIELMTVSAPFWKKTISSSPSLVLVRSAYLQKRAMIPIRLDSEVKGKMFRISTLTTTCPVDVDVNVIDLRSRCDTCRPTAAVHCTIAISSGELAWYEVFTSPVSGFSSMVGVTLPRTAGSLSRIIQPSTRRPQSPFIYSILPNSSGIVLVLTTLIGTMVENKIRNRRAFRYQGRALPGCALRRAECCSQETKDFDHDGVYGGGTGEDGVGPCGVVYGQREGVFDAFCVLSGPVRSDGDIRKVLVSPDEGFSSCARIRCGRLEALRASLRRCGFERSGSGIVGRTTTSPTLRSLLGLVISANEAVGVSTSSRYTQDKRERSNISTERLKKNLNSFHRVRGRKEAGEYLAFEMALAGYLVGGSDDDDGASRPTERVRVEEERSSSSPSSPLSARDDSGRLMAPPRDLPKASSRERRPFLRGGLPAPAAWSESRSAPASSSASSGASASLLSRLCAPSSLSSAPSPSPPSPTNRSSSSSCGRLRAAAKRCRMRSGRRRPQSWLRRLGSGVRAVTGSRLSSSRSSSSSECGHDGGWGWGFYRCLVMSGILCLGSVSGPVPNIPDAPVPCRRQLSSLRSRYHDRLTKSVVLIGSLNVCRRQ
ncbi:phospholipid-translocating P-type ATPase [Hortaea werneckii]|nr:phospholipid-translocating P-type ATPase [Hortaea werneckii]